MPRATTPVAQALQLQWTTVIGTPSPWKPVYKLVGMQGLLGTCVASPPVRAMITDALAEQ
jgi:hypothetical protein